MGVIAISLTLIREGEIMSNLKALGALSAAVMLGFSGMSLAAPTTHSSIDQSSANALVQSLAGKQFAGWRYRCRYSYYHGRRICRRYYYNPSYYYPRYKNYRWKCYLGRYWSKHYTYDKARSLVRKHCLKKTGSRGYCKWKRIQCRRL